LAFIAATGYTLRRWYLLEKNKNNGGQTNDWSNKPGASKN
jgi:hypothetical protein